MQKPHTFHIPVMGTGFTIDTPLLVAKYGITSTLSLVDDHLIEAMRKHYADQYQLPYQKIKKTDPDSREKRITAYLDLIQVILEKQWRKLIASPFERDSEITQYFELLDDEAQLKKDYRHMLQTQDPEEKILQQICLKKMIKPGSVEVNIMTKQQRDVYCKNEKLPLEASDTFAAIRGVVNSTLNPSIVFSAGLNPYLYGYLENFDAFYPNKDHHIRIPIILKVSDYRSALIQGKIFAKKGIWISEFRIESGLNCGGHAFPTEGLLLGPILETFHQKRTELYETLVSFYQKGLAKKGCQIISPQMPLVTAQGGIGTHEENEFLMKHYELDGTGWGSPFLLVPEATSVDEETLQKLSQADDQKIKLTRSSPMGVPFYSLQNSASNEERQRRIQMDKPGSPCINKYMTFSNELPGKPLCTASAKYQREKIKELRSQHLPQAEYEEAYQKIVEKECLCRHLGDGALIKHGITVDKMKPKPAICPGPNIAYFDRTYSLKEMVQHIQGQISLFKEKLYRPNLFINELKLYISYFKKNFENHALSEDKAENKDISVFKQNLLEGIDYYFKLAYQLKEYSNQFRQNFLTELTLLRQELL